ncbi:LPXTG cell wall anchor domain-containing protein [Weissella cibaria]|uniref:LPXTG cell wall anchor domain-containing protein n=1 Tax=Weissella cibaria TaxID=137591 RepID=A0A9Q8N8M4_9LACO|nr:LPXTG cell wall anchor domain-containing protein [Weissella cibaria]TVV26831.1 LPXTG cell wall anchor domain-containing protein [Weissella cibaria]TVV40031.1 LPXTG cell wall anchor domain-containing protein [Weissella cibaria]
MNNSTTNGRNAGTNVASGVATIGATAATVAATPLTNQASDVVTSLSNATVNVAGVVNTPGQSAGIAGSQAGDDNNGRINAMNVDQTSASLEHATADDQVSTTEFLSVAALVMMGLFGLFIARRRKDDGEDEDDSATTR